MAGQNVTESTKYSLYFYIEREGQPPTIHNTLMTEAMAKDCLSGKFAYGLFDHIHVTVQKIVQNVPQAPVVTYGSQKDVN